MPVYQIAVLAILRGVFDILPIGAWAQLVMIPPLLGWSNDYGPALEISLHGGTVLALMLYFRRDAWQMLRGGVLTVLGRPSREGRMFFLLILATLPVAAAWFAARDHLGAIRQSYVLVAAMLIGVGLLLQLVDTAFMQIRRLEHLGAMNALVFGVAQAAALIPGAGRTALAMAAGRFLGFERREAARFALLMAIPVGIGRIAMLCFESAAPGAMEFGLEAAVGGGVAFIAAWMAISFLMRWLKRAGFGLFVLYRVLAGAAILYWYYAQGGA
ncbi:MAG: undecaprenyl-diphosphate phosphatase [Rhodospirillaceae bacterium]|nr:undecaprenyl-diphosphate phosphatase [Rhodospirillaceae bacterium]